MVVHNPNNWHWVDKNCLPWAKLYMDNNVKDTTFEDNTFKFVLKSVDSVLGDCDVTQRKGKVLCIYDMKLLFSIEGKKKDEEKDLLGTITIDEFVHDQDEDEYFFGVTSDHSLDIKRFFLPVLRTKLMKFQLDLILAHGRDVQDTTL
ncbi:hypothetical protein METBIDRAFT_110119 [Metschnikowia bicuspidata var. bicuspidata NRRL YB-4993]|uniref:Activator of Hsp90 ATPase AHSA1-like N-terminal domain-containing protein n=1 Tax=Metschnikowia bicuspidata var. bicuspidata NRRL YB-4993 TaxID=869754 RepID=A0A1A0HHL4_9ASCO|nr:hypothetical protein METBIDRAFT_110119 [Metschnikowia bicuspidata var. bicuspidata NRRL YB-4993]OBA23654.1 hypothetical protein METBIDRAFT_110119 [Metschnikowia bicuspidata var. bicuspidata NRRL YB-4993]